MDYQTLFERACPVIAAIHAGRADDPAFVGRSIDLLIDCGVDGLLVSVYPEAPEAASTALEHLQRNHPGFVYGFEVASNQGIRSAAELANRFEARFIAIDRLPLARYLQQGTLSTEALEDMRAATDAVVIAGRCRTRDELAACAPHCDALVIQAKELEPISGKRIASVLRSRLDVVPMLVRGSVPYRLLPQALACCDGIIAEDFFVGRYIPGRGVREDYARRYIDVVRGLRSGEPQSFPEIETDARCLELSRQLIARERGWPALMDSLLHLIYALMKGNIDEPTFIPTYLDDAVPFYKRLAFGKDPEAYAETYRHEIALIRGVSALCDKGDALHLKADIVPLVERYVNALTER